MNQRKKPPLAIFGLPLKAILVVLVFLVVLLSLFNPLEFEQSLQDVVKKAGQQSGNTFPPAEEPDNEIKATPEMISKAAREVQEKRVKEFESEQQTPAKVNYYLINLADGGSIEAESVSIKPDLVSVITAQGIETVIPRKDIRNIIRLKLDPKPPSE